MRYFARMSATIDFGLLILGGLSHDPKSPQLLDGLIEAAMKSPLKSTLEPTYRQLEAMHLDKSPFVIISVIGKYYISE